MCTKDVTRHVLSKAVGSSQTRLLASGAVDCSLQSGPSTESKQQVFDLCNCAYMLYPWPRRKDEPLSSAALRFPVPEMRDWSQMAAVAAGLGASLLLVLRPRILLARLGGALRSGGLAGLTGVTGLPGLSGLAEAGCTGAGASASGWTLRQCDSTLRNFYSSLSLSVPRTLRAGMLCSLFTLQTSIGPYRSQDASITATVMRDRPAGAYQHISKTKRSGSAFGSKSPSRPRLESRWLGRLLLRRWLRLRLPRLDKLPGPDLLGCNSTRHHALLTGRFFGNIICRRYLVKTRWLKPQQ